jgi:hypothetical protein
MAKREGSPRFSPTCRAKFKACIKSEMKSPEVQKSNSPMRAIGKTCMNVLHHCQGHKGSSKKSRKGKKSRKR